MNYLFASLSCQKLIQDYEAVDDEVLSIHSKEILQKLREGDSAWKIGLLDEVAAVVDKNMDHLAKSRLRKTLPRLVSYNLESIV